MKKLSGLIKCFIIALVIIFSTNIVTKADDSITSNQVTINGVVYTLEKNEYYVSGFTAINNEVIIENSIDGYEVTSIADYAFANCNKLEKITLPESIKDIGAEAFYRCVNLDKVTIKKGTITIGDYAFADCVKLEKVELPETIFKIGENAFYNCKSDLLITGISNTYAETYALDNNIAFNIYVPSKIKSFKVKLNNSSNVKIAWKKSSNANKYEIYRSTKKNKGFKLIKTVNKNSYVDKSVKVGKKYFYKVRAVSSKENTVRYSELSNVKHVLVVPTKVKLKVSTDDKYVYVKFIKKQKCGRFFDMYISVNNSKYKKNNTSEQSLINGFKIKKINLAFGSSYKIKIRTYVKKGSKKIYGKYSNVVQCKK